MLINLFIRKISINFVARNINLMLFNMKKKVLNELIDAMNVIEKNMPELKSIIIREKDKEDGSAYADKLWNFVNDNKCSARLQNVLMMNVSDINTITIRDFVDRYSQTAVLRFRNAGKKCVEELHVLFEDNNITWS